MNKFLCLYRGNSRNQLCKKTIPSFKIKNKLFHNLNAVNIIQPFYIMWNIKNTRDCQSVQIHANYPIQALYIMWDIQLSMSWRYILRLCQQIACFENEKKECKSNSTELMWLSLVHSSTDFCFHLPWNWIEYWTNSMTTII